MIVIILGNVDVITLGIDVRTELGLEMDPLMVIMVERLRICFLETHWDILMVNVLNLIRE